MRHLIIGAGNLGLDIAKEVKSKGEQAIIVSGSGDLRADLRFDFPEVDADVVWCTVGAGSIEGAKADYSSYCDLHIKLPMRLAQSRFYINSLLYFFSTDYLRRTNGFANHSLYELSKLHMEQTLIKLNRPNTVITRVGHLYGPHKPMRTFPGKVLLSAVERQTVQVVENPALPTPTGYIAKVLLNKKSWDEKRTTLHSISPKASVSFVDWARKFMPSKTTLVNMGLDATRPITLPASHTLAMVNLWPDWETLWNEYSPELMSAIAKELRAKGEA